LPRSHVVQSRRESANYPIPAIIEYEYAGQQSAIDEVKRCPRFIEQALRRG
jgi:hypothetical protein